MTCKRDASSLTLQKELGLISLLMSTWVPLAAKALCTNVTTLTSSLFPLKDVLVKSAYSGKSLFAKLQKDFVDDAVSLAS